jgi:hypothetical protein
MIYLRLTSIVALDRLGDDDPLQRCLRFGMSFQLFVTDLETLRPHVVETFVHTA